MKSPFTFKRYLLISLAISALAFVPAALLMRGHGPMWLALLAALLVGFNIPFGFWLMGEVGWRGSRSARFKPVMLRKILIRLAVGVGLIVLSPYIPEILWELDEEMIAGLVGCIAWFMTIYAVGQLIGIGMKRRDRTTDSTVPSEGAPPDVQ